ncbi:MAG: aldo/keto reductase [Lachnospiraceae bacterium]|nr:aldo/keto reductase [Lachnospiraceae bacterium]
MIYTDLCGERVSLLGLGCMRFPKLENGEIDKNQVAQMLVHGFEAGLNYIDTAWPYHDGQSEVVLGELLQEYPRDSYYLADKFPGHQHLPDSHPQAIFEKQLEKCRTDHFDFYLLHNVAEGTAGVYEDPQWGIIDYFLEQKKLGRIRHLGFSCHGRVPLLAKFLEKHADEMEFCQIQFNYLDWTMQNAKEKYELLKKYNMPIIVMEPLRGGKLADDVESSFRWIQGFDQVRVVLSGMSSLAQLDQNLEIFSERKPMTEDEISALLDKAETLKAGVPCTGCGYCKAGCPMELDIPEILATYNDALYYKSVNVSMFLEALAEDKRPGACIGCGACASICPQQIDIPDVMKKFSEMEIESWEEICRKRNEKQ